MDTSPEPLGIPFCLRGGRAIRMTPDLIVLFYCFLTYYVSTGFIWRLERDSRTMCLKVLTGGHLKTRRPTVLQVEVIPVSNVCAARLHQVPEV